MPVSECRKTFVCNMGAAAPTLPSGHQVYRGWAINWRVVLTSADFASATAAALARPDIACATTNRIELR